MLKRNIVLATVALSAIAVSSQARPKQAYDNSWLNGAYHSVDAKSYWSDGTFPKGFSATLNLSFGPNALDYRGVNDTNKNKLYINAFEATLDDAVHPISDNPRFNQIRIRQLGAAEFQVLEQKDGDVIVGQHWQFSTDGKTLVRWGVAKAPDGRSKAFLETFKRGD